MSRSKTQMPKELEKKCHMIIHSATAAVGAIPIPISDAVPITAAQIGMIISLGKVFGITVTQATAGSIAGVTLTQKAGRAIFTNVLKAIPGVGTVIGSGIGAVTAAGLTEALGWIVADEFFKTANGEDSNKISDIVDTTSRVQGAFEGLRTK
ncbi:MAG: GTP-binding protein [Lachnospiraceae bacterium]|nr:GTP-binding protein [Lachnospiraceae bacterium]MDE7267126.1 GTP-binding protein [Lachnospiraceae bacterium]